MNSKTYFIEAGAMTIVGIMLKVLDMDYLPYPFLIIGVVLLTVSVLKIRAKRRIL